MNEIDYLDSEEYNECSSDRDISPIGEKKQNLSRQINSSINNLFTPKSKIMLD
jgi:hypothetical protein